jgi:hypothetical protein
LKQDRDELFKKAEWLEEHQKKVLSDLDKETKESEKRSTEAESDIQKR